MYEGNNDPYDKPGIGSAVSGELNEGLLRPEAGGSGAGAQDPAAERVELEPIQHLEERFF